MRSFLTALQFLTCCPWPKRATLTPEEIGKSTPFFPLTGFCLGLILVLSNRLLEPYLASEILSVVLVTVLILMTRAQHLRGLGETFAGLGRKDRGEDTIEAMGDHRGEIFGLLAILIVLALKFSAIEVMGEVRSQGLLLAPVLGRWAMVILAYGSKSSHEGMDRILVERVQGRHLFLATVLTLTLMVLASGRLGLWISLWVSLLTLLSRDYLHRCLGGVGMDSFGAVGEIGELFALLLFASLY